MYQVIKYDKKYNKEVYQEFVEFVREENFFYEASEAEFNSKLFNNPQFQEEGTFIALDGEKVVGFISGLVRDMDLGNSLTSIFFIYK